MSIEIVRGASRKPVASAKLIDILSHRTDWSGRLFVGYPIARTSTGPNRIDALWISEDKGIVAFDLVEGTDPGDHEFRQDDSANKIERRLRGESGLVRRRRLSIPIHTISFTPAVAPVVADSQADDCPLAGVDSVIDRLACFEWSEPDPDVYQLALSVIDKVSRIRSGRIRRNIRHEDSRGARLEHLENSAVTLCRTRETSPEFLEKHSSADDLIRFKSFASEVEQAEWLAKQIGRNLERDDLHHGDIMVINPDPLTTRKKVGVIRARLLDMGIQSHLAGVDTDPDVFFEPDVPSVTFTGIHRAKGNEAAMIYIINADDCQADTFDLARIRNRLFTAITRSKAWVRVLGVGRRMQELTREFQELKARGFALSFRYPSAEERARLRVIHRDMTRAERRRVEGSNRNLGDLIRDIEHGDVHVEDLDEAVLDKLSVILQRRAR